jgi:hypothetical protein
MGNIPALVHFGVDASVIIVLSYKTFINGLHESRPQPLTNNPNFYVMEIS